MKEVLEEPSTKNGDGALREAPLWTPGFALHHPRLPKRLLLSKTLIDQLKPWRLASRTTTPFRNCILLSHLPPYRLNLTCDSVPQAPEVPRHDFRCQGRVGCRRPFARHGLERRNHCFHPMTISSVSPVHLSPQKKEIIALYRPSMNPQKERKILRLLCLS